MHERLAILADAIALVRAGRLEDEVVLSLVPDLVREDDRHLVAMTAGVVAGLSDHLVPDELRAHYRRFVMKLYSAKAKQLGWTPKPNESVGTHLLRPSVLGLVAKCSVRSRADRTMFRSTERPALQAFASFSEACRKGAEHENNRGRSSVCGSPRRRRMHVGRA